MKKCSTCKTTDISLSFLKYSSRIRNGIKHYYYRCNDCNTNFCRNYRKTEKGKKVFKKMMRKQFIKNYEKILARQNLNSNLRRGKINKPIVCSKCLNHSKLEAHHADYAKPLEVVWLCRKCHSML